ncbi:hypothetical protein, partial [Ferrovum myxofaciens]
EAAIAENAPGKLIEHHNSSSPRKGFFVLYQEDEADDTTNSSSFQTKLSTTAEVSETRRFAA